VPETGLPDSTATNNPLRSELPNEGQVTGSRHVDVLIIGAGPAGTAAAITLAKQGRSVVVLDKASFPRDKCCGDGLTTGALRRLDHLGLNPNDVPSWQWVTEFALVSPKRKHTDYQLATNGRFAAVATREDLDFALVRLARNAGAEVLERHTVVAASQHRGGVHVVVTHEPNTTLPTTNNDERSQLRTLTFDADTVLAADGMWSTTRKLLGTVATAKADRSGTYLGEWHAMRQYFNGVNTEASRKLWIWFEPDIIPGYVWSFPLPDGRVNFGFGIERRSDVKTKTMKALWASLADRPHIREVLGPDATPIDDVKAWPIPADVVHAPLTDGRVMFLGDAARACDVLTGEGIGQALQTGMYAAEAIIGHSDAFDATHAYEKMVREHLTPDHRMAATLQRMMRSSIVAKSALAICGSTEWTRHNFGRWLFEDYPRGIALSPTKWRWGLLSGEGAYQHLPDRNENPTGFQPVRSH
jgi:menaquinone-9 beta-reductase